MHKNSRYLKKFFISYTLILIPSFLIFIFFVSSIFSMLKKEVRSSFEIELEHIKSKYELQYQSFELLSLRISLDSEMATNKIAHNKYSSLRSIQKLQDVKSYDAMISDVFLCFDGKNIYSSTGMSRIDTYMHRYLRLSRPENVRFFRSMLFDMEIRGVHLLQNSGNSGYLLYHFPASMEKSYSFASVNFLVELSMIENMLEALSHGYDSYVGIEFSTGETVVFKENGNQQGYSIQICQTFYDTLMDINDYTTLSVVSDKADVTFYMAFRSQLMYGQIIRLQIWIYLILTILLFAALIISFIFSKHNSYPIQQLAKVCTEIHSIEQAENLTQNQDEISLIRQMISITIDENRKMSQMMKNSRMILSQQTMLLLFHGVLNNSTVANKMMELSNLELDESCFCVVLIAVRNSNGLQLERIDECYEKLWQLPDCEMGCNVTIEGQKIMALLVGIPNQDVSKIHRMEVCKRISNACVQYALEPVCLNYSRVYDEIEQINQAYIEAVYVFKSRLSKANLQEVTFFDDVLTFDLPIVRFSGKEADVFQNAIRSLEKGKIHTCFDYMMQQIQRENNSFKTQLSLRYNVLHMVLHCLMEMGIEQDVLSDILCVDPSDENKFKQQMCLLFEKICLLNSSPMDGVFKDIVQYLQKNYMDINLTLESVAAHVGLSKAYVSRLFKVKTEKRYIDYLTDMRMKEAMRLLSDTDIKIKDITRQVGYCDVGSFQKKFKLLYGLTPAKYRKQYGREL